MLHENITWQITLLLLFPATNVELNGTLLKKEISSSKVSHQWHLQHWKKKPPYMKKNIKKMSPSTVHLVHGTPILSVYELPVRSNTTCFSGMDVFSLVFSIDVHIVFWKSKIVKGLTYIWIILKFLYFHQLT